MARAVGYRTGGGPEVLELRRVPPPLPGPDEVRVRVAYSAINPLDCKERGAAPVGNATVPHYDGSGWVDLPGSDVTDLRRGDRVWIVLARAYGGEGTAQDYLVLPRSQVRRLPDRVSFLDAASAGIPALTAYRCLTVHEGTERALQPGALAGLAVLVPGGAGAVGNASIQLAKWAGARVLTTIRGDEQGRLAALAGADVVVDRTLPDARDQLRKAAPGGVDIVVEVDPAGNAEQSAALCAPGAVVAAYGRGGAELATFGLRGLMAANVRHQWVRIVTLPRRWIATAADGITDALRDGGLRSGTDRGLPLHVLSLDEAAEAHAMVEAGGAGKILLHVGGESGAAASPREYTPVYTG